LIEFHCPHCGKFLKTPDDKAGVRAKCPGCGERVTVPAQAREIIDESPDLDEAAAAGESPEVAVRQSQAGSAPRDTINCPMCGEQIAAAAQRCRYCGEDVRSGRARRVGLAPHRGVLILVLGILGWVCCFPFGIAAWVLANQDLNEMNAGRMDDEGRGLTIAGKVLGIVQCCLLGVGLVFYGVMAVIMLISGQL
jgi:DNA-directed RNA polymerase subunit M/transcription elongation factor TFIIS